MRLFDTHAHIALIHDDVIDQLITIKEARQNNVLAIVNISSNIKLFYTSYQNLSSDSVVYFSVGISPSEIENLEETWELKIEEACQKPKVVAIGETGLDYYWKFGNKNAQIELFVRQLELAERLGLPIIVHNRDAGEDVLNILKEKTPSSGAVFHCYSENWAYAKRAIDLNVHFSFAGSVTYRNARHLHETVEKLPLDRILVESESPFIVPSQHHGKRNKPSYIIDTIRKIAKIRSMDEEELAEALFKNSCRFFKLSL